MTGHHPWDTLLKRLSPERREAIAAGAAKIRADIEDRKEGLARAAESSTTRKPKSRQATARMGGPRVNLDKALSLAAALEDEEIVRKLSGRK